MKVFVAGATGVLGRRVCERLVAAGHAVAALSRSPANADKLARAGIQARTADLFDGDGLARAAEGSEAVLHLATAIPGGRSPARKWLLNDRIRREGTRLLLDAARRGGARLYVQQSIVLIYGDRGGEWVDESTSIPAKQVDILRSSIDMERLVDEAAAAGLGTINLRFGGFYGKGSAQTRMMVDYAKKRRLPIVGGGAAFNSLIHLDDAAAAVVAAVERHEGNLGLTFNIVDDEPVLQRTLIEHLTGRLAGPGKKPPSVPAWMAKLGIGAPAVNCMMQSFRARNARAREALAWRPAYPSYREGFEQVLSA